MTPLIMDYLVKPLIHTLSSLRHTLRFLLLLLCPPIFICLQVARDVSHKSTHDQWMILFINVLLCSVLTLMGYLPGILFCVYITCVKCEPVLMSYTSSLSSNASCMTIHNYNNYKKKNHNNNHSDEDEEEEMVDIMHDSVVHVLPSLSQKQSPLHEVIVIPPLSLHFLSQQREEFDQRLQLQQQQQQLPTTTTNSNSDDDEHDQNIMNDADNDHSMTSIQDMKDDDMSHGDDDTYSSTDQHTEHDAMYSTSTSCSSSLTNVNHSHIHPLHHMTSSTLSSLSSYRSHSKFGSSSSTTSAAANKSKVKKKGYFENEYDDDEEEEEEDYSV